MHYWSVDEPNLYDVRLTYNNGKQQDAIDSYFGMRTFDISGKNILINNDVFYHKLILNQGYYDKGLMTPPTQDWYVNDIIKIKEMGFNGMRIHQKVEQHRLLYLCDHYGLVVWAEMPSFYEFNRRSKELYVKELVPFMKKHMNHPSVIVWTLFNESWGVNGIYGNQTQQQFVNSFYELAKSIDSTRMIIGNDGWEHTKTDILTIHDYTSEAEVLEKQYKNIHMKVNDSLSLTRAKQNFCKGYSYQNEPILISEFGGVAFSKYDNYDNSWGYGSRLDSEEKVINKIRELLTAVMDIEGLCGFCYTQLTDVEQEINGLLNHQHEYKFDVDEIKRILKNQQVYGLTFE
jgi:beta-galactosidase/beta-glucuronidase